MGFIFSLSWFLVNIASKKWQENWEAHIDLLEDEISGPLYKIHKRSRFLISVSKINILVSAFVSFIWVMLGVNYFKNHPLSFTFNINEVDIFITTISIILILFLIGMLTYGRPGVCKNIKGMTKRESLRDGF